MAAEPQAIDQLVFVPESGGLGKRLTATTASSTSAAIPGMGVGAGRAGRRVMFTNGGSFSAFVRMGDSTVEATTDCYELLPGTTQPLGAPFTAGAAVYFAVISVGGDTTVSACAGLGA